MRNVFFVLNAMKASDDISGHADVLIPKKCIFKIFEFWGPDDLQGPGGSTSTGHVRTDAYAPERTRARTPTGTKPKAIQAAYLSMSLVVLGGCRSAVLRGECESVAASGCLPVGTEADPCMKTGNKSRVYITHADPEGPSMAQRDPQWPGAILKGLEESTTA